MSRSFLQYDVFTREPLTGNQLAVFVDARGLAGDRMQALAREMNFSESTVILPSETAGTDVRMRIFTPATEMPMAGHPTIGSAFALAHTGLIQPGLPRFVFGLDVGPTPVDLEWEGERLRFAWMTQLNPTFGPELLGPPLDARQKEVVVNDTAIDSAELLLPSGKELFKDAYPETLYTGAHFLDVVGHRPPGCVGIFGVLSGDGP